LEGGDIAKALRATRGRKAMRSPGVVWPRFVGRRLDGQSTVKALGIDNFGLMFLLVEDSKFKRFGFVEDGHLASGIFTDFHGSIVQGIGGTVGVDLVDDFLELEGQVFGEDTGFLPDQDVR
jgi:hypothetical protein